MGTVTSENHNKDARPLGSIHKREAAGSYLFIGSEGEKPAENHRRIKREYGDACVSIQPVYEWHRKWSGNCD
jgi:hypothetical protein